MSSPEKPLQARNRRRAHLFNGVGIGMALTLLLAGCVGSGWQSAIDAIAPPLASSFAALEITAGAQLRMRWRSIRKCYFWTNPQPG